MKEEVIRGFLLTIFHEIAPEIAFEKIDTGKPLRDQVEIDSFDFYRILVQINKKTGVNIPDSKISELANLDALIKFISEKSSS